MYSQLFKDGKLICSKYSACKWKKITYWFAIVDYYFRCSSWKKQQQQQHAYIALVRLVIKCNTCSMCGSLLYQNKKSSKSVKSKKVYLAIPCILWKVHPILKNILCTVMMTSDMLKLFIVVFTTCIPILNLNSDLHLGSGGILEWTYFKLVEID